MTFWIHFDAIRIATPPKPSLSRIQEHLSLNPLPEISLAERPFHRVFWAQHMSVFLRTRISTTSPVLPRKVPTFKVAVRREQFAENLCCFSLITWLTLVWGCCWESLVYMWHQSGVANAPVRMLCVQRWIWSFLPETPSHQESRQHLTRNQNLYFRILYRFFNYQQRCA